MSYIIRSGNIVAQPVTTSTDAGQEITSVTIACNDRSKNAQGEWVNEPPMFYRVSVRGKTGRNLVEFHQVAGNKRIIFAGDYRVVSWRGRDGQERISHQVWAEYIGVDLSTNTVIPATQELEPSDVTDAGGQWADEWAPEELELG